MSLKLPDSAADTLPDGRRLPPSAQRNAAAILKVLQSQPPKGDLVEIAAGSGLHSAHFAQAFPKVTWHPTDFDPANMASIAAWTKDIATVRPPAILDASTPGWHRQFAPASVLLVNLLHLIPEAAAATVLHEIALTLGPDTTAYLYGPFLRQGRPTSTGDAAFHASLREQNSAIGYKDLDWVIDQLIQAGLTVQTIEMPANNLMLIASHSANEM